MAIIATVLVCGATAAGAGVDHRIYVKNGSLTGKDIKDGSLTGSDIKKGSVPKADLKGDVQNALAIRVTGGLPTQKFNASNSSVKISGMGAQLTRRGRRRRRRISGMSSMNGATFQRREHLLFGSPRRTRPPSVSECPTSASIW